MPELCETRYSKAESWFANARVEIMSSPLLPPISDVSTQWHAPWRSEQTELWTSGLSMQGPIMVFGLSNKRCAWKVGFRCNPFNEMTLIASFNSQMYPDGRRYIL